MTDTAKNCFPDCYDAIKNIGRGGTADIYLATCREHARPIVLKRFYDKSASSLVNRELQIANHISFPGIVKVYGSGQTADNVPFLKMEYCEGTTLEGLPGRVSEKKLLVILSAVAASLTVLHQAGYIHNDLKPSNIFCPVGFENDDFPLDKLTYLKLADFSLTENFKDEIPEAATGTVGYMSPEMILKQKITPSSDFFSLGIMAYQLACGRMPFISTANDPLEINALITEGPRPPLSGPGESLSQELADLIASLLEIDPAHRPPSAFALQEILSKIGSPYPFRKAIRPRHLLKSREQINDNALMDLFGEDSFSPKQAKFIECATGYEPANLRILLEENFDRCNFARMEGRWGWKNEKTDAIEWTPRQIRFGLRPLRGMPYSAKKMALALAILEDSKFAENIADIFETDGCNPLAKWQEVPEKCRPALLYSLGRIMRPATRKAISARLAGLFQSSEKHPDLAGKLLCYAEQHREAIDLLNRGIDKSRKSSEHDHTFELIDLALKAAQELNDPSLQAEVLLKRARLEKDLGHLPESERTFLRTVAMLNGEDYIALRARTYKEMGDLYKIKNDYQSGIKVLKKALESYTAIDDSPGLSSTLNNLGNMYWIVGELDKSLENYNKALSIQEKLGSDKEIATLLNNIGSICVMKGDYSQGIAHFNKSLDIRKRLEEKGPIAQSWNNLGAVHFLKGDAVRAAESFGHSLQLNREVGARAEELMNIENLAEATIQAGRLQQALQYLKEGTALAEELGEASHKCTVNRLTGQLLHRMGYYDEAEAKLQNALDFAAKNDNKALILLCQLGLARLYLTLREEPAMGEIISDGTKIASEMGDKNSMFHMLLVQLSHTGEDRLKSAAEDLVDDLDIERDKALLYLTLLEGQNRLEMTEISGQLIAHVKRFFDEQLEDIDLARYHLALARHSHLNEDHQQARAHAEKASTLAGKLNLLPEQWKALAFLSELEFTAKNFEASFKFARNATDCLKKVAGQIKNRDRLGRFYNDQRITALLGRIKSLQVIMSKTNGAAVGSP